MTGGPRLGVAPTVTGDECTFDDANELHSDSVVWPTATKTDVDDMVGNGVNISDDLIFFRGVGISPTRYYFTIVFG